MILIDEVLIYSLLAIGTSVLVTIIIIKRKKHEDRKRKQLENFINIIFKNTGSKLEVKTLSASNLKATDLEDTRKLDSSEMVHGRNEDNVNDPQHYKLDGLDIESIDVIKAVLGDEFKAFCKGNVLKYVMRADKKNGVEDLKKAKVYLNWILEEK